VFVLQENVIKAGLNALNLTLDFDEKYVLQENMTYLYNTLEVSMTFLSFYMLMHPFKFGMCEFYVQGHVEHCSYCKSDQQIFGYITVSSLFTL